MTKLIDWSIPSEKDIAVYYDHLLKNRFIKKPKPLENVVQLYCNKCCDTIWSRYSGEYVSCRCGKTAIDQTNDYIRILGDKEDYEQLNTQN